MSAYDMGPGYSNAGRACPSEAGLLGAKAFAGLLNPDVLDETVQAGMTVREGIARIGGRPEALAHFAPIGMIFVPSRGGISHAPAEFTPRQDLARGAEVLLDTVLAIDTSERQGNR